MVVSRRRRITLRAPGIAPQGPVVCRKGMKDNVGFILSTGEPIVHPKKGSLSFPLNMWTPPGLRPKFQGEFFGLGNLPLLGRSSIIRKKYKGSQAGFLKKDICIQLPITSYEVRNKKTRALIKTVNSKRTNRDCVTFVPVAVPLLVELEWEGRDDFDLLLTEPAPSGFILSKNNPISETGRFRLDVNAEKCFQGSKSGKEVIGYRDEVLPGTYTINVKHFQNCGDGPTKWNVRVTFGNVLIVNKIGNDNGDFSSDVITLTFDIPPTTK